jgi:hypothetical protein
VEDWEEGGPFETVRQVQLPLLEVLADGMFVVVAILLGS